MSEKIPARSFMKLKSVVFAKYHFKKTEDKQILYLFSKNTNIYIMLMFSWLKSVVLSCPSWVGYSDHLNIDQWYKGLYMHLTHSTSGILKLLTQAGWWADSGNPWIAASCCILNLSKWFWSLFFLSVGKT